MFGLQWCPRGSDFTAASLFPCGGLGEVDLVTGDDCVVSSDAKVKNRPCQTHETDPGAQAYPGQPGVTEFVRVIDVSLLHVSPWL